MHWTHHQVGILIDEYGKYPLLYNSKHRDYTHRLKRSTAVKKILAVLKEVRPESTDKEVLKKMNCLRHSFAVECAKIVKSQQNATNPDEVYTPSIWYFYKLRYLKDFIKTKINFNNLLDNLPQDMLADNRSRVTAENITYSTGNTNTNETSDSDYTDEEDDSLNNDNSDSEDHSLFHDANKFEIIAPPVNSKQRSTSENFKVTAKKRPPLSTDDLWKELLFKRLRLIKDETIKLNLQNKIDQIVFDAIKEQTEK